MIKSFLQIAIIFVLVSCVKQYSEPKEINCIIIPPKCTQTEWKGMPVDTSIEYGRVNGWYYQIMNVEKINTNLDEYALAFKGEHDAYLTYNENGSDKIYQYSRADELLFTKEKEIKYKNNKHLGLPSFGNNISFFCSNKFNLTEEKIAEYGSKDYNSDNIIRIPLNEMMGQTRIFTSKFEDGEFDSVNLFESDSTINHFNFESNPTISPDGNVLFFTSDRNGGEGGTDIWFSILENSNIKKLKWSEPINLSDKINTICDEMSPFISKDNKYLYFSSSGHNTVGGYDIFRSEINPKFFDSYDISFIGEPENLKPPINTEWDEIFPSSPIDVDSVLYYSSNQKYEGNNDFDIFLLKKRVLFDFEVGSKREEEILDTEVVVEFEEEEIEIPKIEIPTLELSGKVVNSDTEKPVTNAEVTVKKLDNKQILQSVFTNKKGEYKLNVKKINDVEILVEEDNTFFDNFILTKTQMDTLEKYERNLYISTQLTLRINFPYDDWANPYEFVLDSNGSATNKKWENELNNLAENILNSIDKLKLIKLVGHTDFVASKSYNLELGKKRVEFVKNELIKRNVPKELLNTRSAGKGEPLVKKTGESVDDYHKRLRRVSVEKIMK